MLADLLNLPITIVNRASGDDEDDYGNAIPTESPVVTVGELQQIRRDEPGEAGETSDTRWLLVVPAGTVLNTGDAVIAGNEVYEVVGQPWPARNPRLGVASHIEATVRRVAGDEGGS